MSEKAQPRNFLELFPTGIGKDHRASIFKRSRSRSLNTPEVRLAHESLTEWLNGENSEEGIDAQFRNSPESTERINSLFKLVSEVTASFEENAPAIYPYAYGKAPEPNTREDVRRQQRENGSVIHFGQISRLLADYATVPYLAFHLGSKLWGVGRWPAAAPGYIHTGVMERLQPTYRPYGEVMAAHGILELARTPGGLSRIRKCDCGRWYFARKNTGVACSSTCRRRIHDRKPDVIAKRKAKEKERYQIHKAGRVKETTNRKRERVKRNG